MTTKRDFVFDRITVIVNPIAGGQARPCPMEALTGYLNQNGANWDLKTTSSSGQGNEFAQVAVDGGVDLVLVAGGDGTINEVASALVGTGVTLGIIPTGSGNGLARSLGVPRSGEGAYGLIAEGRVSEIDVGKANDRYFFLVVGVGFDAVVGKKFEASSRRGPLPYFYLGAREYFKYRPEKVTMTFNGRTQKFSPFLVAVANGLQYGNEAYIAPDAKLNDGLLDICILHSLSTTQLLSAVPKLFRRGIKRYSGAEFHRTENVVIERQRKGYINLDGEAIDEQAVVSIAIVPRGLKVLAPMESPGLV